MCGIVAYLGKKPAQTVLLEGLKRLEYRGYDSSGTAFLSNNAIKVYKTAGRISNLEQMLPDEIPEQVIGIAHTRWATHGGPSTVNAHPHVDCTGKIAIVHNGIIENYATLKKWLAKNGCTFASETDSEIIANLIGYFYKSGDNKESGKALDNQNRFEWAVQQALNELCGTYGLAVMCSDYPELLIGAKKGSPLILGVGENEYIISSDAAAVVEHTTQAIYLADNEMVTITPDKFHTMTIDNVLVTREVKAIEFSLEAIELSGFDHFMQKEILP